MTHGDGKCQIFSRDTVFLFKIYGISVETTEKRYNSQPEIYHYSATAFVVEILLQTRAFLAKTIGSN